ncbi:MAG TPA: HAMP domain-containing sensor histidine kinase [Bryobacteraceae bacterium]|jgi:signal transduction histidine kinase|nr:HAMP domain-containing sensor histidine kinase [Bryobacteraceae bacterium]
MSLRVRLVLVIVVLVTLVAAALSVLHLDTLINSLSEDALQRSELVSQQVKSYVIEQVNEVSSEYATPSDLEETIALWNQIVTSDANIAKMLKMLATSQGVVEINVAGRTGEILASSVDSRVGQMMDRLPALQVWNSLPLNRRLSDLFGRKPDYQVTVPLGLNGQELFTVQVVTSTVLLSNILLPEVRTVAYVSIAALIASLILTAVATNWLLRPVRRLEQMIDRMVQGKFGRPEKSEGMAKEFAAVESKLNVLGEQFRGARKEASEMQHNLDQLLERMESHLDVASRLTAISRITGSVAHEIKNPLNAISLHLDLLRARLGGPEDELNAEIDVLSKEVRRLDRVVKTFLDFSRPVDVRLEEVDLAALAREVSDLMKPQARLAKIDLVFDAPTVPALIRGDADLLKQAILNLVTNALDAMKEGGHLHLRAGRQDDIVTLEVADDGPGIPPELRNKVFQLYFTTKPKGSGIGLAMTYRAVQLHNGTIDFTSENGRGTTFRLQFPALVGHA